MAAAAGRTIHPSIEQAAAVRSAFETIYERAAGNTARWRPYVGRNLATMRRCNGILNAAHRGSLPEWLSRASDNKLGPLVESLTAELRGDLDPDHERNCRLALATIEGAMTALGERD